MSPRRAGRQAGAAGRECGGDAMLKHKNQVASTLAGILLAIVALLVVGWLVATLFGWL